MPTPKSSVSESKLTVDYFQKSDLSVSFNGVQMLFVGELKINENFIEFQIPSEIMSHSAPHAHPLQFTSDQSIDSKIKSDESLAREVQRTISLTSENPSETFFSADEDMHSSSLRTSINDRVNQKKRFASDLRYIESISLWIKAVLKIVYSFGTHSIGVTNDLDGRLLSHRSDYEIHIPADNKDYRVNTKRPQSTAELVSRSFLCHLLLD